MCERVYYIVMCVANVLPNAHKETTKRAREVREELTEVRFRSLNSR